MRRTGKAWLAILACGSVAALVAVTLGLERDPGGAPAARAHAHETRARSMLAGVQLRGGEPLAARAAVAQAVRAEPAPAASGAQAAQVDEAGVSDEQRMKWLMRAHEMVALARETQPPEIAQKAELNFIRRCIGTILHDRGRAHFLDEKDRQRGGFLMGPSENGEFSFVQDCALYQFDRGEFPVHDLAFDRQEGALAAPAAALDDEIHALLVQALDTIDVQPGR